MKPAIPDVLDDFAAYYRAHPAWGSLHIVLDDGNVSDGNVAYCIEWAEECGDVEGARLGRVLLTMSRTQRRRIAHVIARGRVATPAPGSAP